jgi:ABC-type lipoprotein export system ATPase subunit
METVIAAERVHRSYKLGKTELEVLRGVDVEIGAGEHVFLCGASGAGKTTLMYTLAGLERPQMGRVMVEGRDLYQMGRKEQAAVRNARMGYIFQNYYLLPELTALENVLVPAMIGGKLETRRAHELLEAVGLSDRKEHLPSELSGGEQQRVAIARALANNPAMVFADEPTGNLDSKNGAEVMKLLLGFAGESKTTLVVVTHDVELAKLGDRILTIRDGRIL